MTALELFCGWVAIIAVILACLHPTDDDDDDNHDPWSPA